jgi:hypothetical protein
MQGADGGVVVVGTVEVQHNDAVVEHRHMHAARLAPETEQRHLAGRKAPYSLLPISGIDGGHA